MQDDLKGLTISLFMSFCEFLLDAPLPICKICNIDEYYGGVTLGVSLFVCLYDSFCTIARENKAMKLAGYDAHSPNSWGVTKNYGITGLYLSNLLHYDLEMLFLVSKIVESVTSVRKRIKKQLPAGLKD